MAKRRRRTRLGASADTHYDRLTNWESIAKTHLQSLKVAIRDGRCRSAVILLQRSANAIGALKAEESAMTTSDLKVTRDERLTANRRTRFSALGYALEKMREKLLSTCIRG